MSCAAISYDGVSYPEHQNQAIQKKVRNRQNFVWRQVSVLEQVFETEPLPRPVSTQALLPTVDL